MRIVCFTDDSPGGRYTANTLHSRHRLELVVIENAKRGLFFADMKRFGARETLHRTRLVLRRMIPQRRHADMLNRYLGDSWREFDRSLATLRTSSVNDNSVRAALHKIQPDVVVCHGTMLVRAATIKDARHTLNVHHGLSPWYRGSRCVEWAIANGDVLNIGVTVHELTPSIDGGPIVGQGRVQVEPEDSTASITNKIVHLGVEIASDAISTIKSGGTLQQVEQPNGEGAMFWRRQYSRFLTLHVEELLGRGELPSMLTNPTSAPKPLLAPWAGDIAKRDKST
jgi:folate-dependent phosphoribosylglycinamide formyltransferase PurN